jgi:hypothetical protein
MQENNESNFVNEGCYVTWEIFTDVSEERDASMFWVQDTSINPYYTTQCHTLEDTTFVYFTYISVLNATYYLVTLLPHKFRPYMAITRYCLVTLFLTCFGRIRPSLGVFYLAKIVTLCVKITYRERDIS